jgi:hypothetical protein
MSVFKKINPQTIDPAEGEIPERKFIEPKDFFDEVLGCLRQDEISDKLAMMFFTLAEKFCNHSQWVRYRHIRDDLISEAVLSCVRASMKFSPYNKLGSLLINDLVRLEDGLFKYRYKGEEYSFETLYPSDNTEVDETIQTHSERIVLMFDALKDSGSMIEWDGEDVVYDYKICYNPHAFFTMVMSNALKQFLKKEYNQKNIYNKMCLMHNIDPDFGYVEMIKEQEGRDE